MRKTLLLCFIIGLFLIIGSLSWAQCPEGKSEIQLTTPSGIQKNICIPDAALPGIENAADNSDGTIIPSACPCWNEADIKYYRENKMLEYCRYDTYTHILSCYDSNKHVTLEAHKMDYCENYVTQVRYDKLTTEEWNACYRLIEGLTQ